MSEKIMVLIFSIIVILLLSLNFNDKWSIKNYERLKDKNVTWFWFRTFRIKESEENLIRFWRGLSIFVISIMIVSIIFTLKH